MRDVELATGFTFLTGLDPTKAVQLRTFLPTSVWEPESRKLHWKDLECSQHSQKRCPGYEITLNLVFVIGQ